MLRAFLQALSLLHTMARLFGIGQRPRRCRPQTRCYGLPDWEYALSLARRFSLHSTADGDDDADAMSMVTRRGWPHEEEEQQQPIARELLSRTARREALGGSEQRRETTCVVQADAAPLHARVASFHLR